MTNGTGIIIDSGTLRIWNEGSCVRLRFAWFETFRIIWMAKRPVRGDEIFRQMYGLKPECDWPEPTIIHQNMSRLRAEIAPIGLAIPLLTTGGAARKMDLNGYTIASLKQKGRETLPALPILEASFAA